MWMNCSPIHKNAKKWREIPAKLTWFFSSERSVGLIVESGTKGNYSEDLKRRSLKEFETTLTELIAIAPAATIGLRNPNAAIGMPITL